MRRLALNLLALVLVVAFCALGRWQLGREQVKREQLAAAEAALVAAPQPLAAALAAPAPPGFHAVRVEGRARFGGAPVWLDNQRRGQAVGVRLYCVATPLAGADAPAAAPLLVDLGWLPLPGDRTLPGAACPQGEHPLAGLLVPPPATGLVLGPGVEQKGGAWLATRIDPAQLAGVLAAPGLADRVLRLDPALPLGFERDLEMLANTLPPERHRGYAVQWFGLAATLAIIAVVLNLRRKSRS
ncbi:SURF1 family cytochrome oxidase biogenesis protein [Arenimonas composti]|uniref:SURF1-like protein n=1 Tax=Arenimonas composti TR7-09 = DSM 18010 TaxID=1121013 RepID=A0A091BGD5_9GAMM|nr:SURF1 family protein [Arenimonas composti]KFN49859.1 hypothetical protein P873_09045 [Arenimonas composti TR7-09 = DSM 18010]